ncbi:MAG: cation:proton antiporter, partial [Maribacter sp.]
FLIGVGMLIDHRAFFKDLETIKVAIVMVVVATAAKFLAALLTQKTFGLSSDERRLIFGLSNAQAAATLAAVMVGYNIVIGETASGEPIRLLNEAILNGTILMILVTCTIATVAAQRGAKNILLAEAKGEVTDDEVNHIEKILIPLRNEETIDELINLGATIISTKNKKGLYALNVVAHETAHGFTNKNAKKLLEKAAITASATDNHLHQLLRYDLNIVNGITNVIKEHGISDLILGLHVQKGLSDSFLGDLTAGILTKCDTTTLIYRPVQPLGTIKRQVVMVPKHAEKEIGFAFWLVKVWNIGRNSGAKLIFYAPKKTLRFIMEINDKHPIACEFELWEHWDDFPALSTWFRRDDSLIVVMSRTHGLSYQNSMAKVATYLNSHFRSFSFILIFPLQTGSESNPQIDFKNDTFIRSFKTLEEITNLISQLFKRK